MNLLPIEEAVLAKLLEGEHPVIKILRAQLDASTITARLPTGYGFFLEFAVPDDIRRVETPRRLQISGVSASMDGLQFGAGFLLFVEEGKLKALEAYSYDEPWPEEIRNLKVETVPKRSFDYLDTGTTEDPEP